MELNPGLLKGYFPCFSNFSFVFVCLLGLIFYRPDFGITVDGCSLITGRNLQTQKGADNESLGVVRLALAGSLFIQLTRITISSHIEQSPQPPGKASQAINTDTARTTRGVAPRTTNQIAPRHATLRQERRQRRHISAEHKTTKSHQDTGSKSWPILGNLNSEREILQEQRNA